MPQRNACKLLAGQHPGPRLVKLSAVAAELQMRLTATDCSRQWSIVPSEVAAENMSRRLNPTLNAFSILQSSLYAAGLSTAGIGNSTDARAR